MNRYLIFFIPLLFVSNVHADPQSEATQKEIDAAINSARTVCLVGDSVKINMDVSGKVTISKLLPGGEAKVLYENKKAPGAVMFENESIRQNVDKDIRECMQNQWPKILSTLHRPNPEKLFNVIIEPNSQFIDNNDVGDIYASASSIDFYVDDNYVDNMHLNNSMPTLSLNLSAGKHFFRYDADIKPIKLRAVKASCTASFEVSEKAIYRPGIKLIPAGNTSTRISGCSLTKD